jgi:membrane associated rhomboid family serine protease
MQWSAIPAHIVSGHHWITILPPMFMHGSWSHIIGNRIFPRAFPHTEDRMGGEDIFFLSSHFGCYQSSWIDKHPKRAGHQKRHAESRV